MHIGILSPNKSLKDLVAIELANYLGAHKILKSNIPDYFASLLFEDVQRFALLHQNDAYGQILLALWQSKNNHQVVSSVTLIEEIINTKKLYQENKLDEKDYRLSLSIAEEHCKALPDFDIYFLVHDVNYDIKTYFQNIIALENIHHVDQNKIIVLPINSKMIDAEWKMFLKKVSENIDLHLASGGY
ncbi:MAG TPA: hypothetical protein VJZ05_02045 [Bacilli bacterium]|nr:hypothetical protein [Bacilli bacterium]